MRWYPFTKLTASTNWQWGQVKSETLRQKWLFQILHYNLHMVHWNKQAYKALKVCYLKYWRNYKSFEEKPKRTIIPSTRSSLEHVSLTWFTRRFVMRQTSFNGFSRIKIENDLRPSIPASAIQMILCYWTILDSVIICIPSIKWAWSKGYFRYSNVCFLPSPWPWNRQRRNIKNKTLRQTWWLHFSNSQHPFHQ